MPNTEAKIVVLKEPGASVTMHVTSVRKMPIGQYPEWEFAGFDGDAEIIVRVPEQSALRQLARLSFATPEATLGATLTFSRDPNPSNTAKPYWGITQASDAMMAAIAANEQDRRIDGRPAPTPPPFEEDGPAAYGGDPLLPAPTAPSQPASATLRRVFRLHEVCFTQAIKLARVANESFPNEGGIAPDLAGLSALTATLFIAARDEGVLR